MRNIIAFFSCFLCWFFFASVAFSQTEIHGRVINDEDSTPIAFASIEIKNKEAGCIAYSAGNFTLPLPGFVKPTDSLIISSIGFFRSGFIVSKVKTVREFRLKVSHKA